MKSSQKYVCIGQNNKYVESYSKYNGVSNINYTQDIDKALKINDPDKFIRELGLQHHSCEPFTN